MPRRKRLTPATATPLLQSDRPGMDFAEGYAVGNGRIGVMTFGGPGRLVFVVNHYDLWHRPPVKMKVEKGLWPRVRKLAAAGEWPECGRTARSFMRQFGEKDHGSFEVGAYVEIWPELMDGALTYERTLDATAGVASHAWRNEEHGYRVDVVPDVARAAVALRLSTDCPDGWKARVRMYRPADERRELPTVRGSADELGLRMRFHYGGNFDVVLAGKGAFDKTRLALTPRSGMLGPSGGYDRDFLARKQATLTADLMPHANVEAALAGGKQNYVLRLGIDASQTRKRADARPAVAARSRPVSRPSAASKALARAGIDLPGSADDPDSPAHYQHIYDTGRYLFTAACFPGGLPPNLQGIWNNRISPPCFSDYHMDINLPMTMWHTATGNLIDYEECLFRLIDMMAPGARKNARCIFGMRGMSFPGGSDGQGEGRWHSALYMGISGALMDFGIRHWRFTRNRRFLAERFVPMLREVCRFHLDYLQEVDGRLIIQPSISPENRIPERENGQFGTNSTCDLAHFRFVFETVIETSALLGLNGDRLADEARAALAKLAPYPTTASGALTELEDYEWTKGHRHFSHLLAVYPLGLITPETPELWRAARLALEKFVSYPPTGTVDWMGKMGYDCWTGWTYALLAITWARMGEGDRALAALKRFSRGFRTDGGFGLCMPNEDLGLGITFSPLHGKWIQVDAAYGAIAAIQEMLLQSYGGTLRLLPALPRSWREGRCHGFRAEGGFEVNIEWQRGRLKAAEVKSLLGQPCRLKLPARRGYRVTGPDGKPVACETSRLTRTIEFPTHRCSVYTVRQFS